MLESRQALRDFLSETKIPIRLAALTSGGWPIVMSLWFVLLEGKVWCATQRGAKIVSYLRRDPRCAFEVAPDEPPYRGLRGRAEARIDEVRGEEILRILLDRYLEGQDSPLAQQLLSKRDSEIAIELTPMSAHTWDFRKRMEGSLNS